MSSTLLDTDADGVATLRWQPTGKANLLRPDMLTDLEVAFDQALADPSVLGVVLTGSGSEFVGTFDLPWLAEAAASPAEEPLARFVRRLDALLRRVAGADKPVAAALNGSATGLGFEIALACHRRFAARRADLHIGLTDIRFGLPPAAGGAVRLTRLLGSERTLPVLLNGQALPAAAACKAGLVHDLVAPQELLTAACHWVVQAVWRQRQQPAQAAIQAMVQDLYGDQAEALDGALDRFIEVVRGPVARRMVRTLGLSVARADNLASRPTGYPRHRFSKVGVLGAGLMGGGIALVAARAGMDVVLLDVSKEAAERGVARLRQQEETAITAGRIEAATGEATLARITPTGDYGHLGGVDIVVEAVFEDRDVKADATRRAEASAGARALFATNTSTLPIHGLAGASARPSQFIGLHFFSPVPRMPLLEVIRGKLTSDETLAGALDFARAIGKTPIVVNDARGFYTTRVVMAYQAEAYDMVAQGIDPVVVEAGGVASGMPVPPLLLSDAVALDLVHQINRQAQKDLGETYSSTPGYDMIGRLVEDLGRLGKKSGKGFYDYGPDGKRELWPGLVKAAVSEPPCPASIRDVRDRLLAAQALETVRCLEEGVIVEPSEVDVGAILGWGFAPWTGGPLSYIDGLGTAAFVARCDELADRYGGKRLCAPPRLRRIAVEDGTIYGTDWRPHTTTTAELP